MFVCFYVLIFITLNITVNKQYHDDEVVSIAAADLHVQSSLQSSVSI